MLKTSERKLIEVSDWDELIEKTYGKPYSFQQQDGCQERGLVYVTISKDEIEDTYPENIPFKINGDEMGVSFKTWLNTTDEQIKEKLEGFDKQMSLLIWERNFYPDLQIVANDLCRKGLVKPGKYSINIDW